MTEGVQHGTRGHVPQPAECLVDEALRADAFRYGLAGDPGQRFAEVVDPVDEFAQSQLGQPQAGDAAGRDEQRVGPHPAHAEHHDRAFVGLLQQMLPEGREAEGRESVE